MARKRRLTKPDQDTRQTAMYIAIVVRNAMEDFHVQHLSDAQMRELNPLIRNAICTALHALRSTDHSVAARQFVAFQLHMIPNYWEEPVLTRDYVQLEGGNLDAEG